MPFRQCRLDPMACTRCILVNRKLQIHLLLNVPTYLQRLGARASRSSTRRHGGAEGEIERPCKSERNEGDALKHGNTLGEQALLESVEAPSAVSEGGSEVMNLPAAGEEEPTVEFLSAEALAEAEAKAKAEREEHNKKRRPVRSKTKPMSLF